MTLPALDPRTERTRTAVLDATAALLCEEGFERITIDSIAARSDVARSTIYRNWPDRQSLLIQGFEALCAFPDVPDSGSLRQDLDALADHLSHGLTQEAWGRVLPSLIGAAQHDPDLEIAAQRFKKGRREAAVAVVRRAVDRGDVDPDRNIELIMIRFAASFFFTHLFTDIPLDEAFVRQVVSLTMTELTGQSG